MFFCCICYISVKLPQYLLSNLPVSAIVEPNNIFGGTTMSTIFNILDFGAVPDDATDSTAAIQAALAAGKPAVVEVMTNPNIYCQPAMKSGLKSTVSKTPGLD